MRGSIFSLVVAVAAVAGRAALADEVVADDLIVDGSACVGSPCVDGEEFGFDTLRLKGNVLRMSFVDTSASASFPTTDWRITINDADDGTLNRFSIEDLDAGTTPFTIEGGAPNHALYVDGAGRVGIGTATPATDAALDVRGNVRVEGDVTVTGSVTGPAGIKAGIVPKTAFTKGRATVTFATPYTDDYLILLTAVTTGKAKPFKPTVLERTPTGFTITSGRRSVRQLAEVHWMTQPAGE